MQTITTNNSISLDSIKLKLKEEIKTIFKNGIKSVLSNKETSIEQLDKIAYITNFLSDLLPYDKKLVMDQILSDIQNIGMLIRTNYENLDQELSKVYNRIDTL